MKVLFIGGSGNISTACTELAAEQGIDLFVLNRGQRLVGLPPSVRQLRADWSDPESMRSALAGESFDVVVNWIVFEPAQAKADIERFAGNIGQYILIGTASAYQKPPRHYVIREDSTPLENPFWEYSQKKIAVEQVMVEAQRQHGFPLTIVRPSFTYGDTWIPTATSVDFTPVYRMRKGLEVVVPGDGTSLWVMTHNSDFARGFVGLLGRKEAIGEAFHITSDEVLSWNQVYQTIAEAAGASARIVHVPSDFIARVNGRIGAGLLGDKSHSFVFDNSKIRKLVPDFRARVPFAEGIRRTISFLDAHPEQQKIEGSAAMDEILAAWHRAMSAV